MTKEVRAVAERLLNLRLSLATAESCTGGMLGSALTELPGSSMWYRGGLVVYSDDLKVALAGVSPATLEKEGAVSAAVACELALGVKDRCGSDLGIGITGIAGPGGGSEEKPVGTVCFALASESGVEHWTVRFPGDRNRVRSAAVRFALDRILELFASGRDEEP